MKVFNTLTRQKEELKPLNEGEFRIYACGPTVYNFIHIGNARPICVFDVLRRYLEYKGNKVIFAQNFTDIDDKIINRSNEEGKTFKEISEKYIEEYKTDALGLNVRPATIHPKATENIDEIISIIETLIENGFAYEVEGDVYFSTSKFPEYGKLSHQPLDDLMSGARINIGELKKEPMDFALWKASKPGEPYWTSPWGKGRPGWHIECSAMSRRYLGNTIDIHCGGQDLIFPHHENEIAQSECSNGVKFANYWMHNGFITVDNEKMSKSKGNFFTVRDVAKQFGYEPIRLLMISCQYRSPINYSYDSLMQCKSSLQRLHTCRDSLEFALKTAENGRSANFNEINAEFDKFTARFCEAMDDDLNTADAIGTVFELVRYINKNVLVSPANREDVEAAIKVFDELTNILGIVYNEPSSGENGDDDEIDALIAERTQARKEKNWARADEIRDILNEKGIVLEDTPQGVKWHRK
ncbi:MAG: cysteine--tRNA ligase [Oscillospiraceae bacterium]|nr:cysteine--tRNA ligase [Oscillospiraceae bacterium]